MNRQAVTALVIGIIGSLIVIAGLVCLRLFVLIPYRIPTEGMYPTIKRNAVVWAYQLAYRKPSDVHRGDVIVHRYLVKGQTTIYTRRVIGLPGDHIKTTFDAVSVNGKELPKTSEGHAGHYALFTETNNDRSYHIALQTDPPPPYRAPNVDVTVPPNAFFTLGDNRMNSLDSRYTGCVPYKDIKGKLLMLEK